MACGRIQTASEAPNKRGRLRVYVHALTLPVGRAWRLSQPNLYALQRISIDFHASGAVHEIFCSGGYGPSLPTLRASVDAPASCVSAPVSNT